MAAGPRNGISFALESPRPEEVEPQHLAPSDAMSYHQIISSCDGSVVLGSDKVKAKAEFQDPITHEAMSDEIEFTIDELTNDLGADQLYKGDVIVALAQALIVTGDLHGKGQKTEAVAIADGEWNPSLRIERIWIVLPQLQPGASRSVGWG